MKKSIFVISLLLLAVLACSQQPITREVISSPDAPKAIGPYSQAIRVGNTIYLAGQLGLDPATDNFAEGGIEAQSRQALENLKAVLTTAGFTFKDVVQCQVFVTDMNNYPVFNGIYAEYFETDFPARGVVEVSRLPKDGLVEIMMVAVKTD